MQILVSVCRLGVEIRGEGVILLSDGNIKEVDLVMRDFRCEFDGSVKGIDMVKESVKALFFSGPDEKHIIDVPPPNPWAAWGCVQHLLFQPRHEETGKRRCHACSHRRPKYLQEVVSHESEVVLS